MRLTTVEIGRSEWGAIVIPWCLGQVSYHAELQFMPTLFVTVKTPAHKRVFRQTR